MTSITEDEVSTLVEFLSNLSVGIEEGEPEEIYRVIRDDEDPNAVVARDPNADKTVLSHVNCGSRPNYKSQFISFTKSKDIAIQLKTKLKRGRVVKLTLTEETMKKFKLYADLTNEAIRDMYLGKAVMAKNFARAWAEVVTWPTEPLKTELIDTYGIKTEL